MDISWNTTEHLLQGHKQGKEPARRQALDFAAFLGDLKVCAGFLKVPKAFLLAASQWESQEDPWLGEIMDKPEQDSPLCLGKGQLGFRAEGDTRGGLNPSRG